MKVKKKGAWDDTLAPWIIGLLVLVLIAVFYAALSGKLGNIGDYIKAFVGIGR
jgi:hypothetical protein